MYCPNCGQQQISNETRYCSRCGLQLGLIAEVVANGGFLPQLAQLGEKKKLATKKTGVVFGLFWFIIFTMFLTSFFGILGAPDAFVGVLAITGVFGALISILGSLILLPSSKPTLNHLPNFSPATPSSISSPQAASLSAGQSVPAASSFPPQTSGGWRDTSEFEHSSVTEATTHLLTKENEP